VGTTGQQEATSISQSSAIINMLNIQVPRVARVCVVCVLCVCVWCVEEMFLQVISLLVSGAYAQ